MSTVPANHQLYSTVTIINRPTWTTANFFTFNNINWCLSDLSDKRFYVKGDLLRATENTED